MPRYHTLADQLGQVRRASAIVEWACPQVRAEVRGIIAAVAAGLKEVPARPIHTDFKAEHTLLSYGRVLFVDLDAVALGDPVRDAAHFCSYLAGRVGLDGIPPAKARSLAFAFATEYFSHVPKTWRHLPAPGALVAGEGGGSRRRGGVGTGGRAGRMVARSRAGDARPGNRVRGARSRR